jgi:hypothetical protein
MAVSAWRRRSPSARNHTLDKTLAYPAAAPIAPRRVCAQPSGTPACHRRGISSIPAESLTTIWPVGAPAAGAGCDRLHGRPSSAATTITATADAASQRNRGRRRGVGPSTGLVG